MDIGLNCTCDEDYTCPPCREENAREWDRLNAEIAASPASWTSRDTRGEHDATL